MTHEVKGLWWSYVPLFHRTMLRVESISTTGDQFSSLQTKCATCLHIFRWIVCDLSLMLQRQALWKDFSTTSLKSRYRREKKPCWNLCSEHSELFTDQSCTHWSVTCYGTRCGFCCTSEDSHRSVPCMSKGDEVASPRWPKKPLYILNQLQGCELDPYQPNIPLLWVPSRCTLLPRSSNIWFGTVLMCLCSKRDNKFTSWSFCGSLGKCASDLFNLTSCLRKELVAKLNVTNCKGLWITWKFREFFQKTDCEMKWFNTKAHNLVSAGKNCFESLLLANKGFKDHCGRFSATNFVILKFWTGITLTNRSVHLGSSL